MILLRRLVSLGRRAPTLDRSNTLKALAAEPGLITQAQASLAASNCRVQTDPPAAPVKGKR
jgi:hypothetical protein